MKKVFTFNNILAVLFIITGLFMCGYGTYEMFASLHTAINPTNNKVAPTSVDPPQDVDLRLFTQTTEEEKAEIGTYLTNKYGTTFEVLEHTSRFCINQDSDGSYTVLMNCNRMDIINDLYKVQDINNIVFYVKKVTANVAVRDTISSFQSTGIYDSYPIFYKAKELANSLSEKFYALGEYSELKVIEGLGIERPTYRKENKKYTGYYFYDKLGKELFNSEDILSPLSDYLNRFKTLGLGDTITLYVKYNYSLNANNVQDVIRNIYENNLIVFNTLPFKVRLLIEFNDKRYIDCDVDGELTIYRYDEKILDLTSVQIYEKTIILGNSISVSINNGITYYDFIQLDKSMFTF